MKFYYLIEILVLHIIILLELSSLIINLIIATCINVTNNMTMAGCRRFDGCVKYFNLFLFITLICTLIYQPGRKNLTESIKSRLNHSHLNSITELTKESEDEKFEKFLRSYVPEPENTQLNLPNIIFYKTHKTGSSSIQNIMYRLALKHKMAIIWSKGPGTNCGHPGGFRAKGMLNKEGTGRMIANHMRSNDEIYRMMDPNIKNTFEFTILRHPFSLLKSAYNYYNHTSSCFYDSKTFTDLVDRYDYYSHREAGVQKPYCHNGISFDLGYDKHLFHLLDDQEAKQKRIDEIVQSLDKKMNLVLILEHYWESMVLLKDALGISYEDVMSFKLNRVLPGEKETLGDLNNGNMDDYREKVRKALPIDTAIYDHFYAIFRSKWRNYGKQRMEDDVQILKFLVRGKGIVCDVIEKIPKGQGGEFLPEQNIPENKVPFHPPNVSTTTLILGPQMSKDHPDYQECMDLTLPEVQMGIATRQRQFDEGYLITKDEFGGKSLQEIFAPILAKRGEKLKQQGINMNSQSLGRVLNV